MTRRSPRTSQRDPLWLRLGCLSLVMVAFLFGVFCVGLESLAMTVSSPAHFLLAAVLATAFTVPYGALLLFVDRNEREPWWLLLLTFLWGAVVATSVSAIFNTVAGAGFSAVMPPMLADQLTASFSAPPVEEGTKALALVVVLVAFRHHFDNVLDGMLYGALVGLGFAWFENISYYMMVSDGEGALGMVKLAYIRGFLNGIASHAAWTSLTGLGLGLWRVMRSGWLRWFVPPLFLALAMFAHFAWNSFAGLIIGLSTTTELASLVIGAPLAVLVLQAPFVFLLLIVVFFALRHEDELIHRYLEDEPDDIWPAPLRGRLVPARVRAWSGTMRLVQEGPGMWWHRRRQERLLIQLAFAKWHHIRSEHAWELDDDDDVERLRRDLRRLSARR